MRKNWFAWLLYPALPASPLFNHRPKLHISFELFPLGFIYSEYRLFNQMYRLQIFSPRLGLVYLLSYQCLLKNISSSF